jgi:hypothetical protein
MSRQYPKETTQQYHTAIGQCHSAAAFPSVPGLSVPHLKLGFPHLQRCTKITSTQDLLKKTIKHDEKIARSHFLDLEL